MDTANPKACPICGVRMIVTHSRRAGEKLKRKYRTCRECGRRDTMLVVVEQVVGIRVLQHTSDSPELA